MTTKKTGAKASTRSNNKTAVQVAGVIGAVAAATLGAYFYSKTDQGKKQVAKIGTQAKAWTVSAKKDILAQVKKLKEVNKETYEGAVDMVMKKYKEVKKIAPKEIAMVGAELKKHWVAAKKDIGKKIKEEIVAKI